MPVNRFGDKMPDYIDKYPFRTVDEMVEFYSSYNFTNKAYSIYKHILTSYIQEFINIMRKIDNKPSKHDILFISTITTLLPNHMVDRYHEKHKFWADTYLEILEIYSNRK